MVFAEGVVGENEEWRMAGGAVEALYVKAAVCSYVTVHQYSFPGVKKLELVAQKLL